MSNFPAQTKPPYDFGRSIFLPFQSGQSGQSGPGSASFVFKSAFFYGVLMTVLIFLFGKMLLGSFAEFMQFAIEMENVPDDEVEAGMVMKMLTMMGKMFWPILLMTIGGLVIWAMVEAALFRRILRNDGGSDGASDEGNTLLWRLGPWRLGKDEVRVMFCRLIVGMAGFAIFAVIYLALFMVIFGTVAVGSRSGALATIVGIIGFFGVLAGFGLLIFVVVRLAPASALSIAEDRFALGEVWSVTKGRFWPIVGSYAVIAAGGYIVSYIIQMILLFTFMGGLTAKASEFDKILPEELMGKITEMITQPSTLVAMAIALVVYYAFQAIWYMHFAGVSAHAVNLYNIDKSGHNVDVFE